MELFHLGDRPDGVVAAQTLNWSGQVLKTPRSHLAAALSRDEAGFSGVYLLLGRLQGQATAYIGEGEKIANRIRTHDLDKAWWTTAVLITSAANKLDKGHIRYLEQRLVGQARDAGRVRLENAVTPGAHGLGEAACADMEGFIEDLHFVLAALGVDVFTPAPAERLSDIQDEDLRNEHLTRALAADHPRIVRGEERLSELRRLATLAMGMAEAVAAKSAADGPSPDGVKAFARISRAVRLTFALEARFERAIDAALAGRRPRLRGLDAAPAESPRPLAPGEPGPRQDRPEFERLVESDRFGPLLRRPFAEAVIWICRRLGMKSPPRAPRTHGAQPEPSCPQPEPSRPRAAEPAPAQPVAQDEARPEGAPDAGARLGDAAGPPGHAPPPSAGGP